MAGENTADSGGLVLTAAELGRDHGLDLPCQRGQMLGQPREQLSFDGIGCEVADQRTFRCIVSNFSRCAFMSCMCECSPRMEA